MKHFEIHSRLFLNAVLVGLSVAIFAAAIQLKAQVAAPLGTAQNFAILGASTVTSTGPTVLTGDLGVSPGRAITGFPPGTVLSGSTYAGDAVSLQAENDTATAYANIAGQACSTTYATPTDIGGLSLAPGVYCFVSSGQLTGTVTLNAGGNPNAVWIFKTGSTLITANGSSVQLINGAQECKVFWQVGSSATLGTGSTFVGSILALASVTLNTNATLFGRALAMTGAVTLDSNAVSFSACQHACYVVTSKVTNTIMVAPPITDKKGVTTRGTVAGVALSPDGKSVWVTGYNNSTQPGFVSQLNVATHNVESSLLVGATPSNIAFSQDARAWVTNLYDSTLSQISVDTLKTQHTIQMGPAGSQYPYGVAYLDDNLLVTTLGNSRIVPVFNAPGLQPVQLRKAISILGESGRPFVNPGSSIYYANRVVVPVFAREGPAGVGHPSLDIVNPWNATVVAHISLASSGAVPEAVVVTPNGRYAYVSLFDLTGGAGGVWVVDLKGMTTVKVINTGDTANYGEAISADGQYVLVTGFAKSQVALIYTASNSVDNIIQGGQQPSAVALTGDDSEAFVTNQKDGTVTVMSFRPPL